MRIKPKIFITDEPKNPLINVLLEEYENFDIFWFYWKYDGPLFLSPLIREEDYEPIIVVYDNDKNICCVITRRKWNYRTFDIIEDGLILPPIIAFEDEFHHSDVKTRENEQIVDRKISRLVSGPYDVTKIDPSGIPQKFRTGKGHNTNYKFIECDDPRIVAEEARKDYT